MLTIVVTFLLTNVVNGVVVYYAARKVLRHAQSRPEAMKALVEHLLIPLMGGKPQKKTPD